MNYTPTICTIIAKNYMAFARVLCNSFLEQHPDGKVWVLIIDDFTAFVKPTEESFNVVSLEELHILNLNEFCFKYDITELATAVKPYFIDYLFNKKNINKVLYLDPDIFVAAPLTQLFESLDGKNEILLTPHLDTDYPDDGMLPNDSHIMKSGIYNLGFIGILRSDNTQSFLKWWQTKLYDRCIIDHAAGYFVDQKYIDYAFPLFDGFSVIKNQGYNVAYWNLHSRNIRGNAREWTCNDGPLFFFHFSDFKPQRPDEISGHQNRFQLENLPGLLALFQHYLGCLSTNGYHKCTQWPYTFDYYINDKKIDSGIRKMFRHDPSPHRNPFSSSNFALSFHYRRKRSINFIKKLFAYKLHRDIS